MEATVFTGWIYDHLQPHAAARKVAHPLMLRAIAAAKKKNDRVDASKISDLVSEKCLEAPKVKSATSVPIFSKMQFAQMANPRSAGPCVWPFLSAMSV